MTFIDPKKNLINNIGPNVELTREILDNDPWAQKMLNEVGSTMKIPNMKYVGSCAIHYYIDEAAFLKSEYEVCTKTQICFTENISESVARLGFNNAVLELLKHFNPNYKHKTLNKHDKRGVE